VVIGLSSNAQSSGAGRHSEEMAARGGDRLEEEEGNEPHSKIIVAKIRSTRQAAAAPNSYWEE